MNAKKIIAAVALISAAGAALAEAPYPPETNFVSTKTRAEVIAELKVARAQGQIVTDDRYPVSQEVHSSLSRAEVVSQIGHQAAPDTLHNGA